MLGCDGQMNSFITRTVRADASNVYSAGMLRCGFKEGHTADQRTDLIHLVSAAGHVARNKGATEKVHEPAHMDKTRIPCV
jgi:hypothetical protein